MTLCLSISLCVVSYTTPLLHIRLLAIHTFRHFRWKMISNLQLLHVNIRKLWVRINKTFIWKILINSVLFIITYIWITNFIPQNSRFSAILTIVKVTYNVCSIWVRAVEDLTDIITFHIFFFHCTSVGQIC